MKETIYLNKQGTDFIIFSIKINSEGVSGDTYRFLTTLKIEEYINSTLTREEFKNITIFNPKSSDKELRILTRVIKDSEKPHWIYEIRNQKDTNQVFYIGLLSDNSNKESYFTRTENDLEGYAIKATDAKLSRTDAYEVESYEQTTIFETLKSSKIPRGITSKTAYFNNITNIMHYRDFVITPPQDILEDFNFKIEAKIAPLALEEATVDGSYFKVKIEGLGDLTLNKNAMIFRKEDGHQSENINVLFSKPVNLDEIYTTTYTERARLKVEGIDGILYLTYNGATAQAPYDNSKRIKRVIYEGSPYPLLEGDTEEDKIIKKVNARVADVSVKFTTKYPSDDLDSNVDEEKEEEIVTEETETEE